jgi:signal transduction histidine kinase
LADGPVSPSSVPLEVTQLATDPAEQVTKHPRSVRWLVPVIYLGCVLAFVADLRQDNTLAFGVLYIPLVCTAVFHRSPRTLWWLTGLACVLSIIGAYYPDVNEDLIDLIGNRVLSIVSILATALFVRHARNIQDQLAEQTRRAETAEEIKTSVFANLSKEIRTPLYSMVGLLELMMANCRPDQRAPLGQIQSAGRRLLATMENLIDLTRVEEQTLRPEPLDLAALLRQAADASRPIARERQIALQLEIPVGVTCIAVADAWAGRRIVDNLLANAIKFSPPRSSVHIRMETAEEAICAVIQDEGVGMPPDVLRQLGEPFFQAISSTGTGTGLALSRRLAAAMGGSLAFASTPGFGTTAILRLHASR